MKHVAIEKELSSMKNYLSSGGYTIDVIDTNQKNNPSYLDGFDAIVVSGSSSNVLGIEDTSTKIPIIKARGMSQEEVKSRLDSIK